MSPFDPLPDDHDVWCPCGRKMVFALQKRGIDRDTGQMRYLRVAKCPRFDRQWRNLWLGGWRHEGRNLDFPMCSLVWR